MTFVSILAVKIITALPFTGWATSLFDNDKRDGLNMSRRFRRRFRPYNA